MAPRRALVAGATGLTGRALCHQLVADKRYKSVRAMVRKRSDALAGCEQLVCDLREIPPLKAIDDAFCCLGTTSKVAGSPENFREVDFDFVVNVARAAKAAGAKRMLVLSALGANGNSKVFYSRVKGEMEDALAALDFEALHIFRPSFLVGGALQRAESRPLERLSIATFSALSPLLIGAARKYRPIGVDTVARAMISAAFDAESGISVYESNEIERLAELAEAPTRS